MQIMQKIAIWGQFMYSVSLITQLNQKLGEPEVEKYIGQVRMACVQWPAFAMIF